MNNKLYIGIDVAKDTFDAAIWEPQTQEARALGGWANTATGITEFATVLQHRQNQTPGAGRHLIMEPTGGYEWLLVQWAYQHEWAVSLPNPKRVRDWSKGWGQRAKTDPLDARSLAAYGARQQPTPQHPLPPEVQELDSLLRRQEDLEQLLRQERNRQSSGATWKELPEVVRTSMVEVISALETALEQIKQAIKAVFQEHAPLQAHRQRLESVPGVGAKVAPYLLVLLYRWEALTVAQGTAKGLTAYVGLDPLTHTSGRSVYHRSTISKMGNPPMRRLLYMGALGGVRGDNPLRGFYRRLVGRGKAKKLALVAAARKILVWALMIFRQEQVFDPQRATPPTAATASAI